MKQLWNHQIYSISKYKNRSFFGLLFDMGMGKTLTTIRIAEEKERPVLIIAPKALCNQWKEDIEADKEKDWNVVVCTSDTKKKKAFRKDFEKLMETEE